MISFTTVKAFGYGMLLIAGMSVGYGIADTIRIRPLKAKVGQLEAEKSVLNEAYLSQRAATTDLQESIKSQMATCDSRLKKKTKLILELQELCAITSGGSYENPTGDKLLDKLNSLYPSVGNYD